MNPVHRNAFVIDGLVYHARWTEDLRVGGGNAVNVTVCNFESDFEQACDEIGAWHARIAEPDCGWYLIESADDLNHEAANGRVGVIMGWQNSRPLGDRLDRLHLFRRLGLRVMQPTYNFRNMLGDGCLEAHDAGLSSLGKDAVRMMNELGIAIDLSHVGDRTALQVIELSSKPVLITHANAYALSPLARNKSDDLLRALADNGGYIGASVYGPMNWDGDLTRKPTIADYLGHVEYLAEKVGIRNIGFGTDFGTGPDLATIAFERRTPRRWAGIDRFNQAFGEAIPERYLSEVRSHRDLPTITEALIERGWNEQHIRGYLGSNLQRLLAQIW